MRIMTVAFLMAAMLAVGRAAVAQDAPASSPTPTAAPESASPLALPLIPLSPMSGDGNAASEPRRPVVDLPRLDPKRGDKAFAAALAGAQRLQASGEFLQAYGKYLLLRAERPDDPDTLWGVGECGTASAGLLGDASKQRERLTDAKAAYTRYAEVEKRSKYTKGGDKSRVAAAKARVTMLEGQIAIIVVPEKPALAAIPPESPTPGIPGVEGTGDLTPTATPAPEPALVGSSGPAAVVAVDHTVRAPIVVSASDAAAGRSTAQPAGAASEQRQPMTHEDHLKCLIAKGIVTAQLVNVGGKLVMQLRPPPNWKTIPCVAKKQ